MRIPQRVILSTQKYVAMVATMPNLVITSEAVMTTQQAIQILREHSTEYRMANDRLEVLEVYSNPFPAEWVPCPMTVRGLYIWLGY